MLFCTSIYVILYINQPMNRLVTVIRENGYRVAWMCRRREVFFMRQGLKVLTMLTSEIQNVGNNWIIVLSIYIFDCILSLQCKFLMILRDRLRMCINQAASLLKRLCAFDAKVREKLRHKLKIHVRGHVGINFCCECLNERTISSSKSDFIN